MGKVTVTREHSQRAKALGEHHTLSAAHNLHPELHVDQAAEEMEYMGLASKNLVKEQF